jgi:hypothetical protein
MNAPRDLYVGYLPMPAGHGRFVRALVVVLVVMVVGGGALVAAGMRRPGAARWHGDRTVARGTVVLRPYPMLIENGRGVLLVLEGKHGAARRFEGLNGREVEVTGTRLESPGMRMIEVIDVHALGEGQAAETLRLDAEEVTLRGEIVDSKCALGAMKPGDGKTHKACATLCVSNGIPPMLARHDRPGEYVLLADTGGGAANGVVLEFVGEPVDVVGVPGTVAGMAVLSLREGGVRRAR